VLTGEVTNAKFIVFILTDGGSNPLSTTPKAEHANNYTTDAARDIFGFYRDVIMQCRPKLIIIQYI
jgi:hypothetical protein